MSASKDLIKIIREMGNKGTSPYDTEAEVIRVDNDTAWVHIAGGVDETPVARTIDCKAGDTVQVRVTGGTAFLIGNATAPPTDDTKAKEAQAEIRKVSKVVKAVKAVADTASKIAGNTAQYFWHTESGTDTGVHITEIPREDFLADPENGGANLLARSNGLAIRNGLKELAIFASNLLRIGDEDAFNIQVTDDELTFNAVDSDTGDVYEIGSVTAHDTGLKLSGSRSYLDLDANGWRLSQSNTNPLFGIQSVQNARGFGVSVFGAHMELEGDFYINGHSEPIGTIKTKTASKGTPTADISSYTDGASVTLGEGTWIVIGTWSFHTITATGARQTSVRLDKDGTTLKTLYICNGDRFTTKMEITDIVVVSNATAEITLSASSSKATTTADTQTIKAIRIL